MRELKAYFDASLCTFDVRPLCTLVFPLHKLKWCPPMCLLLDVLIILLDSAALSSSMNPSFLTLGTFVVQYSLPLAKPERRVSDNFLFSCEENGPSSARLSRAVPWCATLGDSKMLRQFRRI